MDLGLGQLNDDQLLELLEQGCAELAQRDRFTRECAQGIIDDQAEILKLRREAAIKARDAARSLYREELRAEAVAFVNEAYKNGELQLLQPNVEANEIAISTKGAIQQLLARVEKELKDGKNSLSIAVVGPSTDGCLFVSMQWGDQRVNCRRQVTPEVARNVCSQLRLAFGVPF